MHDDEEMKAQCFGGEYMGEVYDNNLKRMQLRRQKRWWNAYMLFYTRCDQVTQLVRPSIEQLSLAESRNCVLSMPAPIEKSVRSQNLRFLHSRNLFSTEFFNFIRKLVEFRAQSTGVEKLVRFLAIVLGRPLIVFYFVFSDTTSGRAIVIGCATSFTISFSLWIPNEKIVTWSSY